MAQQREIQYNNKSFTDLRQQLIDYAKNYFPDTYNDFSPTSPGMMFIEMAAYVGDVLSFYQDIQLQETLLQYAQEPSNLYSLAYMMGYRPKVSTAAIADIEISQEVPAKTVNGEKVPDFDFALSLAPHIELESTVGSTRFITQDKVDFWYSSSYDPTDILISETIGGSPSKFKLTKKVKAYSATVKTKSYTINNIERFTTLQLTDTDILGILSIVDEDGNEWTEVPYLAQDTILTEDLNPAVNHRQDTPYVLEVTRVPRRYVTRFKSNGTLDIQFGAGQDGVEDSKITPDPTYVGLGDQIFGVSKLDVAYDPSNFMYTGAYGIAPQGTLTVTYLVGGSVEANVSSNTITNIANTSGKVTATNLAYETTLAVTNPKAATGGRDGDTVEELRQNSLRSFNEQLRVVTKEDYNIRALTMPARLGSVAKVYTVQDQLQSSNSTKDAIIDSNPLSLSMYILSYDSNKNLAPANMSLKENLKKYLNQYRMLTDAVNIKDAFIVNIGIKYDIIIRPSATGLDVLTKCTEALQDYFAVEKWSINQSINVSKIYTLLDKVKGVQTVKNIEIYNKAGGGYSKYAYDVKGATKNNIVYPSYDPCIFEIKYPDTDIEGRITTL
jgi:hypothetical protein